MAGPSKSRKPSKSPDLIDLAVRGEIAHVRLTRPQKRNALSDALIAALHDVFASLPAQVKVAVVSGEGEHFCAGLDLAELAERDALGGVTHSRSWHAAFGQIALGRVPVIAALHGAVVGGGLELAAAAHLRVAEKGAFFALPEGSRGLFVGGGGSARIPRLIGVARMTDMMLTGRVLDAVEAERIGLISYLTEPGGALPAAMKLAEKIAGNSAASNFAIIQALPRIAEQGSETGLFTESLMAAIAGSGADSKKRMSEFLAGRANKVVRK